jgi:ABC-type uncharacterized transport system permease subunit
VRTFLAIVIFLFGTTFWWMHAAMAGQVTAPRGVLWTLTNVLSVLAILGCAATAWAVLRNHGWWVTAALVSGALGLLAVALFVPAQRTLDVGLGDMGVQLNVWMHLLGSAGLLVLALTPALRTWITDRP